jgi:hypothetical protein
MDPIERSHQVAQMAEVYRAAQEVHIWLGTGSDDLDAFMQYVEQHPDDRLLPTSLEKMIELPYWSRLWIMQEVLLARRLYVTYGRRSVVWNSFFQEFDDSDSLIRNLGLARHRGFATGGYRWTWQDAFWASRGTKCEDPRDKIYGLLGLVDPNFVVQPDYMKTLEDLYCDVIHAEARAARHDYVTWKWVCDMWREELRLPGAGGLSGAISIRTREAAGILDQEEEPPRVILRMP